MVLCARLGSIGQATVTNLELQNFNDKIKENQEKIQLCVIQLFESTMYLVRAGAHKPQSWHRILSVELSTLQLKQRCLLHIR